MDPSIFLGLLFCLAPFVYGYGCYMWGRYGLPFEVRRRRLVDRRRAPAEAPQVGEAPAVEVYRYDPTN